MISPKTGIDEAWSTLVKEHYRVLTGEKLPDDVDIGFYIPDWRKVEGSAEDAARYLVGLGKAGVL